MNIIIFLTLLLQNQILLISDALNCWTASSGVSSSGAYTTGDVPLPASYQCPALVPVCKKTTWVEKGFSSNSWVTLTCESNEPNGDSTDDPLRTGLACATSAIVGNSNVNGTYSPACSSYPCTRTFTPADNGRNFPYAFVSSECTQTTDGNKPAPANCYVGTFSLESRGVSSPNSLEYCKVCVVPAAVFSNIFKILKFYVTSRISYGKIPNSCVTNAPTFINHFVHGPL